ncbi:MAG: NADPH-dependent assimilatory sulfite reductase hemoprotein subunit [Pseudomonadota bacterium]
MTDKDSLSPVEGIKTRSKHLRGTLKESLVDPITGAIADDDTQVSKFHGIYQQDDRDRRAERQRQKLEPAYSFMIRGRLPGGRCTPAQWLAIEALGTQYAATGVRLTTRQAFQFHGVVKGALKPTIQGIDEALLDTIAACGDVNRNVMCSPNPDLSGVHREVDALAGALSAHLTPQTRAYHEIWLDGEKLTDEPEVVEPIYGDTYLPRKFKTGFVIPPQNDVDVYTQDLGFVAIVEDGALIGFNVTAGGGMGSTHGDKKTFPRLADTLGFITPDRVLDSATAVVTTQRDFGNRSDRKNARLKYTIEAMGLEAFREQVETRQGFAFAPTRDVNFTESGDHLGWVEAEDGVWHFGLFIPSGRVRDHEQGPQYQTGLIEIAKVHKGEFRMTPNQNLIIAGVQAEDRALIAGLLAAHGLALPTSKLAAGAMACVALPTCALAMADAERFLPELTDEVAALFARHGLPDQSLSMRVTGCPNGCARPFVAEVALVGKAPRHYNLYLGGRHDGTRLNKLYRENISFERVLEILDGLIAQYAENRGSGEAFGDFCIRSGVIAETTAGRNFHDNVSDAA